MSHVVNEIDVSQLLIDVICVLGLGSACQLILSSRKSKARVRPRLTQLPACHTDRAMIIFLRHAHICV